MKKEIFFNQIRKGFVSALPFLSVFLIAFYFAKFTNWQSLLLAFVFQYLFEKIKIANDKMDFTPHQMIITPKWKFILETPNLFTESEKELILKYLNSKNENLSKQAALNMHLQFISKQLTYLVNFKSFKGDRLHFNIQLSEDWMGPLLWIKAGRQGYEVQISSKLSKIHSNYPGDESGYFVLGVIPYEIVSFYYGKDSIDFPKRKKTIESYGLKYEDQSDMGFFVDPVYDGQYFKLQVGAL